MKKAANKRHKHGTTMFMVFTELVRLYGAQAVSRHALVKSLRLAETTIDDRLRVLIIKGMVEKAGRGLYRPCHTLVKKQPENVTPLPAPTAGVQPWSFYNLSPETDPGLANAMKERGGS